MRSKLLYTAALASCIGAATAVWNHNDYLYSPTPDEIPNPDATGSEWEDAFARASNFVSQLTTEEKVGLVSGTEGPCVGNIAPIYRLNFTGLCIQNGPLALEQGTYSSVFPAGITIAATWDKNIAYERGSQMAAEFRGKGSQVLLGPVAGPLGRSGLGGRNWEGFSPDPYLTGELFTETILGIQDSGVQACAKHYIGNEQETQRQPSQNEDGTTIESVSSNIDDRTMHELYLWPFQQAVKAGVASVMCSYNRLNQTYGCQNSKAQNGILKGELGFQGYVMSDWGATHSGAFAINAGEDMDMPGTASFGPVFFNQNLIESVKNGSVSMDRLDDMCRRVMTPYFHLNQDKGFPAMDPVNEELNAVLFSSPDEYKYNYTYGPVANVDVRGNHGAEIRKQAADGIVLLKNTNNTLPLKSPKHITVFGNDAGDFTNGMSVFYFNGVGNYEYGVLAAGGGSGSGLFTYLVSPLEAIKQRAGFREKTLVQYVLNNSAIIEENSPYLKALLPSSPDVCLVFLKSWATEGEDRTSLHSDWNGDEVVEKIASTCPNTVVVTHSNGVNVLPWADHPNVTAILAAHLPGQEAGSSIVDVLWGDVNPSGHLPYTIAKRQSDYSFAPIQNSTALQNTDDPIAWQSDFKEGVLIDYRHFDYYNKTVQYEFGYGLSYTTFSIGKSISITPLSNGELSALPADAKIIPGGNPNLWEVLYRISITVKNTGQVAGAAVPQLYLSLPKEMTEAASAVNVLRGFEKVQLQPGEARNVTFQLTRRDLSRWDVTRQQWAIPSGLMQAYVGFSSRDFRVAGSFTPIR
ncbi:glycoside hydrolase superfamily [Aspergillus caelatus]|uniref:Probable beta-glucosidase G n=1 Tax=Aspergillus caelatus TaxID=61420 RepID=A0A5N7ALL9_9EURO|nr:glycoside hydrolase superfamily [Aspergillus caelatus]KAE8370782.1 glycoside hydrolase superfamily [Aspergillus caelatus]